jgi:hypothetical protein
MQQSTKPSPHPFLVEIRGRSMEPTLCRGSLALVEPRTHLPGIGDVVAIRGRDQLIVHRVVHVAALRAGARIYHAGDAAGAVGRCSREALLGRVVAVVDPEKARAADLEHVSPTTRRRLRWARWRCRAEAAIRTLIK